MNAPAMTKQNSNGQLQAATNILDKRLKEKVCIITGGASGLGEAAAHLFAAHGAHVIIADVQDVAGQAVAASLPPPGRHLYRHCDVSQEADVAATVDLAVSTFDRLDVMFNNAAVISSQPMPLSVLHMDTWDRIQAVNVRGVVLGMKHAARVMAPARRGAIINTTSVSASLASQEAGIAYTASKHAVLGLTKAGAVELGKFGVRVNSVAPYTMLTPMVMDIAQSSRDKETLKAMISKSTVLKGHFLEAQDVAEAALFLASDEARYISGHNLAVDGGMSIASRTLETPPHLRPQN